MSLLERIRKEEDVTAPSNHSRYSYKELDWVCERCWSEFQDQLSEYAGRPTLEVSHLAEDENSHFLLSF